MAPPTLPAAVTVHEFDHAVAALRAAVALERKITLLSAPAASGQAGIAWFAELIRAARGVVPGADSVAVLDCDRHGGRALAALRAGLDGVIFTGSRANFLKLADIAEDLRVTMIDHRPKSLDLLDRRDPETAVRDWLAKH